MVKIYCEEEPTKESFCKQLHYFEGVHSASLDIQRKLISAMRKKEDLNLEDLPEEFRTYLDKMVKGSRSEKENCEDYFMGKGLDLVKETGERILEIEEDQIEKAEG